MLVFRLLPAATLLLGACTAPAEQAERSTANAAAETEVATSSAPPTAPPMLPEVTPAPAPPANVAQETVGGDGSDIALAPLRAADADSLKGELACSFATEAKAAPLLLARANVGARERGTAAVRNAGVLETLVATSEGGFGAMEKGTTFGGKGLTVRLSRQARIQTGDESSAHSATLRVQRADGAERSYAGAWTCGP